MSGRSDRTTTDALNSQAADGAVHVRFPRKPALPTMADPFLRRSLASNSLSPQGIVGAGMPPVASRYLSLRPERPENSEFLSPADQETGWGDPRLAGHTISVLVSSWFGAGLPTPPKRPTEGLRRQCNSFPRVAFWPRGSASVPESGTVGRPGHNSGLRSGKSRDKRASDG